LKILAGSVVRVFDLLMESRLADRSGDHSADRNAAHRCPRFFARGYSFRFYRIHERPDPKRVMDSKTSRFNLDIR